MADEIVYGVPIPKYGIGSTFWVAGVETKTAQLPCPDCNGTRLWKAVSPAGVEHELSCPRCGDGYRSSIGGDRLPSLKYTEHMGVARLFTVRGMDIRSHGWEDRGYDDRISYYSDPHGGTVYHEHQAYDTQEAAQAVADLEAAKLNASEQSKPEFLQKRHYSAMTIKDAILEAAHKSAFDAWWAYTFLKEDVENHIEDNAAGYSKEEMCRELEQAVTAFQHFDGWRAQYVPPSPEPLYDALERLLEAVVKVADEQEAIPFVGGAAVPPRLLNQDEHFVPAVAVARKVLKAYVEGARPAEEKNIEQQG